MNQPKYPAKIIEMDNGCDGLETSSPLLGDGGTDLETFKRKIEEYGT